MKNLIWLSLMIVGLAGCATHSIQTNGRVDQVTWLTTELDHSSELALHGNTERFSFALLIQETSGTDFTLTKITWEIEHDGVDLRVAETRTGSWQVPAHSTLRQQFVYRIYCPSSADCPDVGATMLWDVAFEGYTAQRQPLRFVLQPILPWTPTATANLASGAPTHREVTLPPIHIISPRIYYPLEPLPRR